VWLISLVLNLGREEGSLISARATRHVESKGIPLSCSEGVVEGLVNLKESEVASLYLTTSPFGKCQVLFSSSVNREVICVSS